MWLMIIVSLAFAVARVANPETPDTLLFDSVKAFAHLWVGFLAGVVWYAFCAERFDLKRRGVWRFSVAWQMLMDDHIFKTAFVLFWVLSFVELGTFIYSKSL